jgi:hypothetical protein
MPQASADPMAMLECFQRGRYPVVTACTFQGRGQGTWRQNGIPAIEFRAAMKPLNRKNLVCPRNKL